MSTRKFNITQIEALTETEIRETFAPDFEAIPMKGFTLYLLNLGEYFGYSMICFGDGRQIRWANDYELHHQTESREKLRELYIEKASRILYTEEELAEPLKSYGDYERRRKFIVELLPLKRDFLSGFCITRTEDEKAARKALRDQYPVFSPVAFGYFREADREYALHLADLDKQLAKQEAETAENYDYNYSAFFYELGNHEYHINTYQGDWDTLSCFGNIEWRGQGKEAREQYFKELGFTEIQRKAFEDARRDFLKKADDNDWY